MIVFFGVGLFGKVESSIVVGVVRMGRVILEGRLICILYYSSGLAKPVKTKVILRLPRENEVCSFSRSRIKH